MKQPILYIFMFIIILLCGCSFIANANGGSDKKSNEESRIYDVSMETEIVEFEEYHIAIHYPQTTNNKIDQSILDYVNQQKAYFKQESYKSTLNSEKERSSRELHIDFEVVHQDHRFFVVRFIETMDLGGKVVKNQTVMNFDKKNSKPLKLEELFKEDVYYVDELHDLVKEKLSGDLEHKVKANLETYQNIGITGEGMFVYLDRADSELPAIIKLDRDEVLHLLRPKYAEAIEKMPVNSQTEVSKQSSDTRVVEEELNRDTLPSDKKVALTFDDGPHPKVTEKILQILDRYDAKASFFMIGKRVSYYPEVAREVANRGHEIGNHTWSHPSLKRLSPEEVERQISSTQKIIKQVTEEEAELIRLPYGEQPPFSYKEELKAVPWSIYSEKWKEQQPSQVTQDILSKVEDGSVILLHDLNTSTVETVELIIQKLTAKGYRFVPVSEIEQ